MLANVPKPVVFEKGSAADIRAIDVTNANSYWFVRVTTDPSSVWRWSPTSGASDNEETGVLKPTQFSIELGRWVFYAWDNSVFALSGAP